MAHFFAKPKCSPRQAVLHPQCCCQLFSSISSIIFGFNFSWLPYICHQPGVWCSVSSAVWGMCVCCCRWTILSHAVCYIRARGHMCQTTGGPNEWGVNRFSALPVLSTGTWLEAADLFPTITLIPVLFMDVPILHFLVMVNV